MTCMAMQLIVEYTIMSKVFSRACVTGGAGFIGSKLVRQLLQNGLEVLVIDNLSVGRKENIPQGAEFYEADILNNEVHSIIASCDVIFHLAARVAIRSSFEFVTDDTMTNVIGTVNLLKAATTEGSRVKKFVFASSMAVYADTNNTQPVSETDSMEPISPYGVSKLAGEMLVKQLCTQAGVDACTLRLFNTYGNGQALSPYVGVMTIFANAMLDNKIPAIFGDGMQCRDFVHVDDVVNGFIIAMQNGHDGQSYNIGSGTGLTINDVYKKIAEVLNFSKEPDYAPAVEGELRYSIANIDRAKNDLGYKPQYQFAQSVVDVLNEIKYARS